LRGSLRKQIPEIFFGDHGFHLSSRTKEEDEQAEQEEKEKGGTMLSLFCV
jgi:hypothetical protein